MSAARSTSAPNSSRRRPTSTCRSCRSSNSPDIVVGVLRNDVHMMVDFPAAVKGQVDDGKLTLLATSGPKRSPSMPNLATVAEAGVPDYEVTSWNGMFAPRGTPDRVVTLVNTTLKEVLAMPDVKQRLLDMGIEARPSSPDDLMALFKADVKKWDDGDRQSRHREVISRNSGMPRKHLRIAIVGAGMGGLAAAATLRQIGCRRAGLRAGDAVRAHRRRHPDDAEPDEGAARHRHRAAPARNVVRALFASQSRRRHRRDHARIADAGGPLQRAVSVHAPR